jgi:hypothetical protein
MYQCCVIYYRSASQSLFFYWFNVSLRGKSNYNCTKHLLPGAIKLEKLSMAEVEPYDIRDKQHGSNDADENPLEHRRQLMLTALTFLIIFC